MANVSFYLKVKKPDKMGRRPVIMQITFDKQRIRLHIGEKVNPKFWNDNKQRVAQRKDSIEENVSDRINKQLDELESKTKKLINDAKLNSIPLSEEYFMNGLYKKEPDKTVRSFFELFKEYIDSNKPNRAISTIKSYTDVMHFFQNFEKDMHYHIDISNITLYFFDSLKKYAFVKKSLRDNYFAKIIRVLKSFLTWAKDREIEIHPHYMKFRAGEHEKEVIYLSVNQLMELYKYEFESPILARTRDIYCFACLTGLRISDIRQLEREHINGSYVFKTIKKTQEIRKVVINDLAAGILNKYLEQVTTLPLMFEQDINQNIKECCRIAGFDEPVRITVHTGGKQIEVKKPLYQLITTHTARKTFITDSLILGMNPKAIKEQTGLKKDSTFNRYLKVTEEYVHKEMDNSWNKLR